MTVDVGGGWVVLAERSAKSREGAAKKRFRVRIPSLVGQRRGQIAAGKGSARMALAERLMREVERFAERQLGVGIPAASNRLIPMSSRHSARSSAVTERGLLDLERHDARVARLRRIGPGRPGWRPSP